VKKVGVGGFNWAFVVCHALSPVMGTGMRVRGDLGVLIVCQPTERTWESPVTNSGGCAQSESDKVVIGNGGGGTYLLFSMEHSPNNDCK